MMNEAVETDEQYSMYSKEFGIIKDNLTLFKMQINMMQQQLKNLEKSIKKDFKNAQKGNNKKDDKKKASRLPSGFAKPTKVTKELCDFLEKPEGTELARTEVTKMLVTYIQTHNLIDQAEDAKNKIIPDEKLKNLLGLSENEEKELNYFNIQKYMNKHFYSKKLNSDITNNLELQ
jgi:hypothetical protein